MTSSKSDVHKYGVRIFKVSDSILLVKQTIKSGSRPNDAYVIDGHRERHVSINDDSAIANAVRDAITGELKA